MRVGGWNSVISNSRLVFMPASLTVLLNTVPTPTGPSVALAISSTRGLNFGSLVPSARKSKTCSIGRSTTVVPSKRPATGPPQAWGTRMMPAGPRARPRAHLYAAMSCVKVRSAIVPPLLLQAYVPACLVRLGVGPPVGDLAVAHVDDPARRHLQLDPALDAAGVPVPRDEQPVADALKAVHEHAEELPGAEDLVAPPQLDLLDPAVGLALQGGAEGNRHHTGVQLVDHAVQVHAAEGFPGAKNDLEVGILHARRLRAALPGGSGHSHSIVPGGLDVMSNVTRFTCAISLIMREATFSSRSYGSRA